MLNTIGEASTTTLDGSVTPLPFEVSIAVTTLDEILREMQMDSYVFNTEYDVTLLPVTNAGTGETKIPVASNYLRIQNASSYEEYTVRQGYLYSMKDKTDSLSSAVTVDVVYALEFVDLPEAAKRYTSIRAARVYADRLVGSRDIRVFSQQDEFEAKAKMMDYEVGVDNINMLRDNPDTYSIVDRRGPASWL